MAIPVQLDDDNRITRENIIATRQAQQQQQQQPQEQPASTGPVVIQAVSGRPGQPTTVLVNDNGVISAGAASDFGPGVQAQADQYIQSHLSEQPADSVAARTGQQDPLFRPSGQKVRIDDLPQGGDFSATRDYLSTLPNGTQVQIGEGANEDVYVYNGGLVNSRGQYYKGYGGLTQVVEPVKQDPLVSGDGPYNRNYAKAEKRQLNVMGDLVANAEVQPAQNKDVFEQIFDYIYGGYKPQGGSAIVDWNQAVTSSMVARTSEVEALGGSIGGPAGSVVKGLGYIGTTPFVLGSALTGVARTGETVTTRGVGAAADELAGNLGRNTGAMIEGAKEDPLATIVTFAPVGFGIAKAARGGAGAGSIGSSVKGGAPKVSVKEVVGNTKPGVSEFRSVDYAPGGDLGPVVSNSDVRIGGRLSGGRVTDIDAFMRGEPGKTNVGSFVDQKGNKFKVIYNENVERYGLTNDDMTRLYNNQKFVKTSNGETVIDLSQYSSADEVRLALEENQHPGPGVPISMKGLPTDTKYQRLKSFLEMDDRGSAQIGLMERPTVKAKPKTRASTVERMMYNPVTRTGTRNISFNRAITSGSLMSLGSFTGALGNASTRSRQSFKQITGPGPVQRVPISEITITNQRLKEYTGTSSSTKPRSQTKTSQALMLGLGLGVGTSALTASRMFSPGRMKGVGGDNGGGFRMFGSSMNKQKYMTGDVTSLMFGKPKKKQKRR